MHITASHHDYAKINELWNAYAQAKNVHIWFNLRDLPLEFQLIAQKTLWRQMDALLNRA